VRPTLALFFLGILVVTGVFVSRNLGQPYFYSRFANEFQQNMFFVGVLLTFLLWISMTYLRSESRRFVLLVSGLGIYFSAHAVNYALQFLLKSDAATATIAFLDALTAEPDRWLESPKRISAGFGMVGRDVDKPAKPEVAELGGMVATAIGSKEGQRVRYSCWPAGPWESTVGPLAAAALGVLRGDIRARGVLPPEAVLEPIPFLREAARYGPKPPTDGPLLDESREILV